jgi:hypothetical protein
VETAHELLRHLTVVRDDFGDHTLGDRRRQARGARDMPHQLLIHPDVRSTASFLPEFGPD